MTPRISSEIGIGAAAVAATQQHVNVTSSQQATCKTVPSTRASNPVLVKNTAKGEREGMKATNENVKAAIAQLRRISIARQECRMVPISTRNSSIEQSHAEIDV